MKEKISLEEATIKALYDDLNDKTSEAITSEEDVEGVIDDILVITDPEVSTEEYQEVIDNAQELVEETPEGEIPFDDSYVGEYIQRCPICGSTFSEDHILEAGEACPICMDEPEAFVLIGKLETEESLIEEPEEEIDNENIEEEPVSEEEDKEVSEEEPVEDEESDLEKDLASKQVPEGNKLTESTEDLENRNDNDKVELPSTTDGTAKKEIEDMLERSRNREQKIGLGESKKEAEALTEAISESEVVDLNQRIEAAEDMDEIQAIIYEISDGVLEDEVQAAYDACIQDGDDLDSAKGFIITTLEDNAEYLEESKKLQETGEWDDSDDDMKAWKESMKKQAEYLAKEVNGKVVSVDGFDKYQGPYAVINTPKHGYIELWYDPEDDNGLSFIVKINNIGSIAPAGLNYIATLLNKDEIPEEELIK